MASVRSRGRGILGAERGHTRARLRIDLLRHGIRSYPAFEDAFAVASPGHKSRLQLVEQLDDPLGARLLGGDLLERRYW